MHTVEYVRVSCFFQRIYNKLYNRSGEFVRLHDAASNDEKRLKGYLDKVTQRDEEKHPLGELQ